MFAQVTVGFKSEAAAASALAACEGVSSFTGIQNIVSWECNDNDNVIEVKSLYQRPAKVSTKIRKVLIWQIPSVWAARWDL